MKVPKPTTTTATVEQTSVTPRQRPKGQGVATGPISLSGQIVSQLSGQGNQATACNHQVTYIQVNQQIAPSNTPQAFNQQQGTQHQFSQTSPHLPNNSPQVSQAGEQSSSPLSNNNSPQFASQQSPVTDSNSLHFDSRQTESTKEDNLEALFSSSSNFFHAFYFFLN